MKGEKEAGEMISTARIQDDISEFIARGGQITKFPPEQVNRRHFETAAPVQMVTPHISPWHEERLEKAEALLYKLNISGNDPLAVRGTRAGSVTSFDVWAALVSISINQLASHQTWGHYPARRLRLLIVELQIYKNTLHTDGKHDQASHQILFVELLYLLLDRKRQLNWVVKKPKIIENMVLVAIQQVCIPGKFRDVRNHGEHKDGRLFDDHRGRDDLSARAWAAKLGLVDHHDWSQRWQGRYFDFLNDLTALDVHAITEIEKQL